jgi:hypothetical protein
MKDTPHLLISIPLAWAVMAMVSSMTMVSAFLVGVVVMVEAAEVEVEVEVEGFPVVGAMSF